MGNWTALAMLASTKKLASWRGDGYASSESMELYETIPFKGMGSIVYHWIHKPMSGRPQLTAGSKNNKGWYDTYLEVQGIKYGDSIEDSRTWTELDYKGEKYYYEKPKIDVNPIRTRCNCSDYRFRGSFQAYNEHVLYGGKFPGYTRKTPAPPVGRPYVNDDPHRVIMCKHLYNSIVRSQTMGYWQ